MARRLQELCGRRRSIQSDRRLEQRQRFNPLRPTCRCGPSIFFDDHMKIGYRILARRCTDDVRMSRGSNTLHHNVNEISESRALMLFRVLLHLSQTSPNELPWTMKEDFRGWERYDEYIGNWIRSGEPVNDGKDKIGERKLTSKIENAPRIVSPSDSTEPSAYTFLALLSLRRNIVDYNGNGYVPTRSISE